MLENIVSILGISGAAIAAVAWLCKSLVSHFLKKEMANYEKRAKIELSTYKSDLEKRVYEHHIRFVWLHKKRAILIEDIYKELNAAYSRIDSKYNSYFPVLGAKFEDIPLDEISQTIARYSDKVHSHPLYFTGELHAMLIDTGHRLESAHAALQFEDIRRKVQRGEELDISEQAMLQEKFIEKQMESHGESPEQPVGVLDETMKEIVETKESVEEAKQALVDEFRKMLGAT